MNKSVAMLVALLGCIASPGGARAASAFVTEQTHLRAGPALDYPVVATLPAGYEVDVLGCLQDYSWCDVVAGEERGWLNADFLRDPWQGGDRPLHEYGAAAGITVFTFVPYVYWHEHYRDRPFFHERHRWLRSPEAPPEVTPHVRQVPRFPKDAREPPPAGPASESHRQLQRGGPATESHRQLQQGGPATERLRQLQQDEEVRERLREWQKEGSVRERVRDWRREHSDRESEGRGHQDKRN